MKKTSSENFMRKAILFVLCFLLFSCSGKSEKQSAVESVIENYFACLEKGNLEKLNELRAIPLSTEGLASINCFESIKITDMNFQENDDGTVQVNVEFDVKHKEDMYSPFNEGSNHTTFELKMVDDEWKVASIGNA